MTAQTSRYKLTYPTGSDLVSGAPAQFKSLAESVDTALGEVDDRHTQNAVVPVVRTTLAQLAGASAVTGQTGYVTADSTSANNGAYVYNGSAWVKYAMKSDVDDLADQITQGYESGNVAGGTDGNGVIAVNFSGSHSSSPSKVLLQLLPGTPDAVMRNFLPMVWAVSSDGLQARLMDLRTNAWAGAQPLNLCWLAIW